MFNLPGWFRWSVTVLYLGLVNWLLLAPSSVFKKVPSVWQYQDKLVHFGIFLLLALLLRWSLPMEYSRGRKGLAVLAGFMIYAASIEVLQPLLTKTDRVFEWPDLLSNIAGLITGWFFPSKKTSGDNFEF
ncbi:MAG: hypothetical protein EPN25_06230 [Nitrospirae bacterium]|nr:MAG: hypothetical protein EPN25_06230 [Nitrospirota bacterium]